jgi:hypothetical protein
MEYWIPPFGLWWHNLGLKTAEFLHLAMHGVARPTWAGMHSGHIYVAEYGGYGNVNTDTKSFLLVFHYQSLLLRSRNELDLVFGKPVRTLGTVA